MAGLFGMTPEEQRALDMAEGQDLMKAGQQLGGGMLMYAPSMGRMQSESIMGALQGMGVSTPSQRKEEQVKEALQGLDYNNPASMMEAARKLLDLGMTAEAQQLVKAAQEAQMNVAKVDTQVAMKGKYVAEAEKDRQWLGNEEAKRKLEEKYRNADRALKEKLANADDARQASLVQAQINKLNKEAQLAGVKLAGGGENAAASIQELRYYENLVATNPTPENQKLLQAAREKVSGSQRAMVETQRAEVAREQMNSQFGVDAAKVTAPAYEAAQSALSLDSSIAGFKSRWENKVPEQDRSKIWSDVAEFAKFWTANQDARSEFLMQVEELQQSQVFDKFKQMGGTNISNKDLEFALKAVPPKDAAPEVVFNWMNRLQDGARKAQQTYELAQQRINEKQAETGKYLTQPQVQQVIYQAKKEVLEGKTSGGKQPIGTSSKPDGVYNMNGKQVTVKGGLVYE